MEKDIWFEEEAHKIMYRETDDFARSEMQFDGETDNISARLTIEECNYGIYINIYKYGVLKRVTERIGRVSGLLWQDQQSFTMVDRLTRGGSHQNSQGIACFKYCEYKYKIH